MVLALSFPSTRYKNDTMQCITRVDVEKIVGETVQWAMLSVLSPFMSALYKLNVAYHCP